jgi:tellurite resistance protein TerC
MGYILSTMIALWIGFLVLVLICLALDLGVFHKTGEGEPSLSKAIGWSLVWITVGVGFSGVIYYIYESGLSGALLHTREGTLDHSGKQAALLYLTSYLLEKSLSVDNLFVIAIVFKSFRIAQKDQHRILYWGIIGALITRGIMIFGGLWLVERFEWLFYVFGAYLGYQGLKLFFEKDHGDEGYQEGFFVRQLRKVIPIAADGPGDHFTTRVDGKLFATPAFLALVVVELTDLMFAVDSVPAVLAVSTEPYIVYTSNIFAILGLRALYSVLAEMMERFHYLKYALAIILMFVGVKLCLHHWVEIPSFVSLSVILGCMVGGIAWSFIRSPGGSREAS